MNKQQQSDQALFLELAKLTEQQQRLDARLQRSGDHLQRLVQRVWALQEREHKQIATELHDGVGQLLTALVNQLELLVVRDDQPFNQNLLSLSRQALADVRQISRLMRPQILDDLGLEAAVKWLCRQMTQASNIDLTVDFPDNFLPPESLYMVFFRVCQEGLSNIVKHAQARQVDVLFTNAKSEWRLLIGDDGRGFEPQAHGDRFGLCNIEDRVASYGGSVTIDSSPGQGCRVEITIPKQA